MSGSATPYAVDDDVTFWSDDLSRRPFTAAGATLPARVRRDESPPRPEVRAHSQPGAQCVFCLDRPTICDRQHRFSYETTVRPERERRVIQ